MIIQRKNFISEPYIFPVKIISNLNLSLTWSIFSFSFKDNIRDKLSSLSAKIKLKIKLKATIIAKVTEISLIKNFFRLFVSLILLISYKIIDNPSSESYKTNFLVWGFTVGLSLGNHLTILAVIAPLFCIILTQLKLNFKKYIYIKINAV